MFWLAEAFFFFPNWYIQGEVIKGTSSFFPKLDYQKPAQREAVAMGEHWHT